MALDLKRLAAEALPIVGGLAGAAGGTFLMPGAGTAAGGAAGSGMGEYLKQRMLGEQTNVANIAMSAGMGALPGLGRMGGKAAAGGMKGYLRDQSLKKITPDDVNILSDYSDYMMKRFEPPKGSLNSLIANARISGKRGGIDVTSGSAREVELRIGEALERASGLKGQLLKAEVARPNNAYQSLRVK